MSDEDMKAGDSESDDDDLFMGPAPALDDDDDDDEFDDDRRVANFNDDSDSAIIPSDGANSLGSSRKRRHVGDDDDDDDDEDDVASRNDAAGRSTLTGSSRKNKRKNFRPRNIVYNATDDDAGTNNNTDNNGSNNNNIDDVDDDDNDDDDDDDSRSGLLPLNLSAGSESQLLSRKTLMPRKIENNSASFPIDLSVASTDADADVDAEAESRPRNLSVVRPEILFGGKFPGSDDAFPFPAMQFGPSLAAIAAAAFAGERHPSVKEIFQEALKMYGVSAEFAEAFTKNMNNSTPGKTLSKSTDNGIDTSCQFRVSIVGVGVGVDVVDSSVKFFATFT